MKKTLLAFLLVLSLMFSAASPAFAASREAVNAADGLYTLGLFNGVGTDAAGDPIYDLDREPTRDEAVTMLVRLLGKEAEALSGKWKMPFTDVEDWAEPYVGYAYANGLTAGTSATTYEGEAFITVSQYITFVLRALGYDSSRDFEWDKAWVLSDKLGFTQKQYDANTGKFTRGDICIISYNALNAHLKGKSTTLKDQLVKDGAVPSLPSAETIAVTLGWKAIEEYLALYTISDDGMHNSALSRAMLYTEDPYTLEMINYLGENMAGTKLNDTTLYKISAASSPYASLNRGAIAEAAARSIVSEYNGIFGTSWLAAQQIVGLVNPVKVFPCALDDPGTAYMIVVRNGGSAMAAVCSFSGNGTANITLLPIFNTEEGFSVTLEENDFASVSVVGKASSYLTSESVIGQLRPASPDKADLVRTVTAAADGVLARASDIDYIKNMIHPTAETLSVINRFTSLAGKKPSKLLVWKITESELSALLPNGVNADAVDPAQLAASVNTMYAGSGSAVSLAASSVLSVSFSSYAAGENAIVWAVYEGGGETAVVGVSLWLDDSGVYHVSTCALPYGRMVGDVLNGSWENSPICQLFGDPDIVAIK